MRAHEVQLGRMVVAAHEQIGLVFVRRRVCTRRLRRCSQTLEVELIRIPLAVNFGHDVLVVVVPERNISN